jgi:hypothetical protein
VLPVSQPTRLTSVLQEAGAQQARYQSFLAQLVPTVHLELKDQWPVLQERITVLLVVQIFQPV